MLTRLIEAVGTGLEKLNSPGGHIVLYMALLWTGILLERWHSPEAHEVLFGSFTALLATLTPKAVSAIANGLKFTDTPKQE